MMTIFIPLSPISFSSASQATILMSCFLVSCVLFTLFWVLLYVNGIALCPLFFFSTQQYAFKMHPFALLYILFIVSNNYLFIKVYFTTFWLFTLQVMEIYTSFPLNNSAFLKHTPQTQQYMWVGWI